MTTEAEPVSEPGGASPTRRQALAITAASLAGALAGYIVMAIASKTLSLELNAVFAAFWSAMLTTYGALTGLNTETARSVAAGVRGGARATPRVARLLVLAPAVVLLVGTVAALTGLHPFYDDSRVLAFVVAASATIYAGEAVLLGALAGRGSWGPYAGLLGLEALGRLVLVGAVAFAAASLIGIATAAALATSVWILLLACSRSTREAARSYLGEGMREYLPRAGSAVVAAAASGILLVGFPVMVSATTPPEVYLGAAALMYAITLTRAPIMVPLTAFQSVIVSHFVRHPDRAGGLLVKIVLALFGVGGVGAGAAYLLGPWIMTTIFGPDYWVAGGVLAAMTFASAGTAVVTVTAAMCQATKRHVAFLAGWLLALVATIVVLLLPWDLTTRVVVGLLVPPYLGAAVHAASLLLHRTEPARD